MYLGVNKGRQNKHSSNKEQEGRGDRTEAELSRLS